jgi:hypothetical protein
MWPEWRRRLKKEEALTRGRAWRFYRSRETKQCVDASEVTKGRKNK